MEAQDDQLATLKQRIRRLERALSESEALTLAQIECSKRLEHQVQERQEQLEERDQQLARYQAVAAQAEDPDSHIQELQDLVWELERRPSLEQYGLLKQQFETAHTEIDTLKYELSRRPDPVRLFELQQEIAILKEYTQHLTDRSAGVIQVQQKYLELRSQYNELEAEVQHWRQQGSLDQPATPDPEAQARIHDLESQLTSQLREFDFVLMELDHLKNQLHEKTEANTQLQAMLTEWQQRPAVPDLHEELIHWQQANQQLSLELATTRYELEHLRHDRIDPSTVKALQDENQHLHSQLQTFQSLQQQLQADIQQFKLERVSLQDQLAHQTALATTNQEHSTQEATVLATVQSQLQQTCQELELAQVHIAQQQDQIGELTHRLQRTSQEDHATEALLSQQRIEITRLTQQLQEAEADLAHLPNLEQWQEMQRRQELTEAHYVVNQKQLEKLQQKILELETECVQAHAHAQMLEKETAQLEDEKQNLELRLMVLQTNHLQSMAAPASSKPMATASGRGLVSGTVSGDEGIPPFSVDAEIPPLPRPVVAAAAPASIGQRSRVELPAFVRRR